MLPWAIRRRSASGVESTSSICSARADDGVGDRLLLPDAGDPLDDVVERLEVLDVHGGDDVDPGVEQLLDVLPALLVPRARGRSCGRARRRGPPRGRGRGSRRGPSPRTTCRGGRPWRRGITGRSRELLGGARPVVGLDVADDDVGAALGAAPALVEHGEGLADARRGAQVDAQAAACSCATSSAASRARLSSRTFTPSSPRNPSDRPAVCSSTSASTVVDGQAALLGDPGGLEAGVGDGDVRVDAGARGR